MSQKCAHLSCHLSKSNSNSNRFFPIFCLSRITSALKAYQSNGSRLGADPTSSNLHHVTNRILNKWGEEEPLELNYSQLRGLSWTDDVMMKRRKEVSPLSVWQMAMDVIRRQRTLDCRTGRINKSRNVCRQLRQSRSEEVYLHFAELRNNSQQRTLTIKSVSESRLVGKNPQFGGEVKGGEN